MSRMEALLPLGPVYKIGKREVEHSPALPHPPHLLPLMPVRMGAQLLTRPCSVGGNQGTDELQCTSTHSACSCVVGSVPNDTRNGENVSADHPDSSLFSVVTVEQMVSFSS